MIKVEYFPNQAHCYAFGGFEMQMLDAGAAARNAGINVIYNNPWEREQKATIVHHWGAGYGHINNLKWAKASGQKIVITLLVAYYDNIRARLRGWLGTYLGESVIVKRSLALADLIVVVNEMQATTVKTIFGVTSKKIAIIPNIVSNVFFEAEPVRPLGDGYWVTSGNVCPRKNQLLAAEAAIAANVPLVIVGNALNGCEEYADKLRRVTANSGLIKWISALPRDSAAYVDLLRKSTGLLLPSRMEQQPITALEMSALGKPIILGDVDYARQDIFKRAVRVPPNSVGAISAALKNVSSGTVSSSTKMEMEQCRADIVGAKYAAIYDGLKK